MLSGMTWNEITDKYRRVALGVLGIEAPEEEVQNFMFKQILYKSCSTNGIIDSIACTDAGSQPKNISLAGIVMPVSTMPSRRLGLLQDVENAITKMSFWIANKFGSYPEMRRLVGSALADNVERALTNFCRVLVTIDQRIFAKFSFKKLYHKTVGIQRQNTTHTWQADEHIEVGS